jgi:hypothetical protein
MKVTGGCFCGRVRYRISVKKSGSGCDCAVCKEAFGSPASDYTEVMSGSFAWICGDDNLTVYECTPGWGICFCKTCGTTLCGMHGGQVHGVNLGTADSDRSVRIELH